MRVLLAVCAIAAAAVAMTVTDDLDDLVIGKVSLLTKDVRTKEKVVMKLLNHVLQLTPHKDIRDCALEFVIEDNVDKYLKVDVVKDFIKTYKLGMLPRGEIFTISNELQMREVVKVFHMLYFAKDFDTFVKTACWLRERINAGMFVYAITVAVLHRDDCRGIVLPAPYEIYPYYFVDSNVIHKAYMIKMKRGALDNTLQKYYGIKVTDKNVVVINEHRDFRTVLTHEDKLKYFTEDIDLNTYFYYFHMEYPVWMSNEIYGVDKDRRGELYYYVHQQLTARHDLERLSHEMCPTKVLNLDMKIKNGHWPNLLLHTGYEMPVRMNNVDIKSEDNTHLLLLVDDYERRIRDAIMTGHVTLRDGTTIDLKKPEDIEILGRLCQGNLDKVDVKFYRYLSVFLKTMLGTSLYNKDKHMYIPTVLDQYETSLRDPLFYKLVKRLVDNFVVFKKLMPSYTRDELNFKGVKVEKIVVDKLMTYFDEYDMDITNAVILDEAEKKKERSDFVFLARKTRLNNKDFKIMIEVDSEKATDAVVRVFLGPKYDCMGKLIKINDKRHLMVEIDTFIQKLQTGKTTIVRNSLDMHNVLVDRVLTRKIFDKGLMKDVLSIDTIDSTVLKNNYWWMTRLGFPKRLLLPKGHRGGLEMQLFVIVTPVNVGKLHTTVDMEVMKNRHVCRSTVCYDMLPLGYPFDRHIDVTHFYTDNMLFTDVLIFHKDLEMDVNVTTDVKGGIIVKKHDLIMENDIPSDIMLMDTDQRM